MHGVAGENPSSRLNRSTIMGVPFVASGSMSAGMLTRHPVAVVVSSVMRWIEGYGKKADSPTSPFTTSPLRPVPPHENARNGIAAGIIDEWVLRMGPDYSTLAGCWWRTTSGMMGSSWMGSHFTNDDLVQESMLSEDYTMKKIFSGTASSEGQGPGHAGGAR